MSNTSTRVAVVSGGSRGLGLAICETLLAEGYRVATFSRRQSAALERACGAHDGRLYWEPLDVADDASLASYLQRVRARFGRVGYLVNSAGIAHEGLLTMMKGSDVSRMLAINLGGAVSLAQQCVKQMMVGGSGVIVNISSVVGVRGYKGVGVYSATKAALDGLTRSLAKELGSLGIRVNSVAPGFMETEMVAGLSEQQKGRLVRQTPLGRLGTVDDVSAVVAFLLSDAARFVTGQTVVVDGGLTT
ncbi:SDR family NAD(P)-dependent oxidoreductase [Paraburkholderia humisilvae]|uniref:3-oxoacyl-[acyl-carrier-protein] reductase FabG n=1 Tax=Paraburkholderia humisilvae TaxID=627669 RepID=A0A6J5EJ88_9BURK|nr:SDR family oxidoreductase [Paraburkholderia humisilvae]CAB3765834.1 3-oxoacyl-[acyl-carrier-protein] reductase FabG [Paraburkholderia humisilvae]